MRLSIFYSAFLCLVLLCFFLLCFALLCFALLCYALFCFILFCFGFGFSLLLRFALLWFWFVSFCFLLPCFVSKTLFAIATFPSLNFLFITSSVLHRLTQVSWFLLSDYKHCMPWTQQLLISVHCCCSCAAVATIVSYFALVLFYFVWGFVLLWSLLWFVWLRFSIVLIRVVLFSFWFRFVLVSFRFVLVSFRFGFFSFWFVFLCPPPSSMS